MSPESNDTFPAKLVLPTVATCRWRQQPTLGQSAVCGLVLHMIGDPPDGEAHAVVSDDACAACCQSFPPSESHLNPVVAALLFQSTGRIIQAGGLKDCPVPVATRLRKSAQNSLILVHDEGDQLIPARRDHPCAWLGEAFSPKPTNSDLHSPESGHLPTATTAAATAPAAGIWRCDHVRHETTTVEGCRKCRDWVVQRPVSEFMPLRRLLPLPSWRSETHVRRWAVGITTAPRRESTLELCLDSVVRAGWERPHLFLDGTVRIPTRYNHLPITWREESVGALPAWQIALTELVLQQPHANAYMLLQDDVVLYDRESLRDYLELALWPEDRPGIVSLFYTGLSVEHGWIHDPGQWHWGAQAFVFAPATARGIVSDAEFTRASLRASSSGHLPIPETLSEWVGRSGTTVWHTSPSLSQHIGNTSTVWEDAALIRGRRAHWFSGSIETPLAAGEALADFNELCFPCVTSPDRYHQQVRDGYRRMRESRVVLCGIGRNVRPFLPRTAARAERLGACFQDHRVILFENDSNDGTREFLADWQSTNSRVTVISEVRHKEQFSKTRSADRATWLAECRNRYRAKLIETVPDFDFVIVFDLDLPGGWSYDGIAHSFGGDGFDFVGSYGVALNPDSEPGAISLSHVDVWAFHPARGTAARTLVDHSRLQLQRGDERIPVESCFGGLGIYTMDAMKATEYGGPDCEHVVFHRRLAECGRTRLFLNPSQVVLYSP